MLVVGGSLWNLLRQPDVLVLPELPVTPFKFLWVFFTNNLSSQSPCSWSKSRMTVPATATGLFLLRSGWAHPPARYPTWKLGPVLNSVFCNFQVTFFPSVQTIFIHLVVICFCFLTKSLPLVSSLAPVDCKPHAGAQIDWKFYKYLIKLFLNRKHVFSTSLFSLVSF